MKGNYFVKKDAVVSITNSQVINAKVEDKDCHLCGKCRNIEPSLCAKVKDVHKKNLADYDFITEGYQSFDKRGDCDHLIVEKCENYVPMVNAHKNKVQLAKYKKLKQQIICGYFDTATSDEAYLLQVDMYNRGHLNISKYHLPSEKTLKLIRQRAKK